MESIDQSKGHSQNKTMAINFLVSMLISCHMLFGRHWLEFTPSMQINAGLLALLLEKVRLDFKRKKTEGKVRASYTVGRLYYLIPKDISLLETVKMHYRSPQIQFTFLAALNSNSYISHLIAKYIILSMEKCLCLGNFFVLCYGKVIAIRIQYNIKARELYFIKYKMWIHL